MVVRDACPECGASLSVGYAPLEKQVRFSVKYLFAIRPAFLTICLILIVVVLFTSGVPLLDWMELKTYDLRVLSRGYVPPTPAVVLALVDEKSLVTEGRWPWSRAKFAALVD